LDYVYFIAQSKEFASKGSDFIAGVGKILWWILWIILVLSLLYAGTLMLTSRWDEEAWKKSKTIIKNILIAVFVIFLFLVIAYDLFKNFWKDISV
jgi:glucan phosphoethanolaminetransferase (alkaline phosphatase superfamily)